MDLNTIWFILFVIIIAGYLILDGFDMGVGVLHLFVAQNDDERRVSINSIGPVWDGNEVWLVLGGGALFGAFPFVYAALFSGFYTALMLLLLVLILRAVAIEFRSKRPSPRWRSSWDFIFWITSLGLALLLGVAFGNILSGVPVDANGNIQASLVSLLTPFALLVGVTTVSMVALHGAIYLSMKSDGEMQARVLRWIPILMAVFFVLTTLVVISTVLFHQQIDKPYLDNIWFIIFPLGALAACLTALWLLRRGREFSAFIASAATIALLIFSVAVGMFPNMLFSTINPQYNLTVYNAASESNTLTVMLIVALIGLPIVILYTVGVYYFFRGKTDLDAQSY